MNPKAVVLVSGGLDSATVLAMVKAQGYDVYALSFDYGQRHRSELDAARRVAEAQGAKDHRIVKLDLALFGGSALTDSSIDVPTAPTEGIPVTYVPARNTVLLSVALAWAEVLHASAIGIGVNAVDYSGYPDCRPEYIAAFEKMANLATKTGVEGEPLKILTPLIDLPKSEIIRQGMALGVDYGLTVSCYMADDAGRACGVCDSCRIRKEGFANAGVSDPTHYQA
ncbi:7-cyano-7-deazaguanine synthase QueC [Leeia oryzae]|uniref:7-cyano-7-deazaguanine synthase QueC n=1 Tax=Leeia oryzae TaxID=356662 RepID=UPI0003608F59|nr:7-cyano-7-deazaguanine synthase QueC [Leeia oryzae]